MKVTEVGIVDEGMADEGMADEGMADEGILMMITDEVIIDGNPKKKLRGRYQIEHKMKGF